MLVVSFTTNSNLHFDIYKLKYFPIFTIAVLYIIELYITKLFAFVLNILLWYKIIVVGHQLACLEKLSYTIFLSILLKINDFYSTLSKKSFIQFC